MNRVGLNTQQTFMTLQRKKKLYSGAIHLLTCIRSVIPNRMTYLKNILPLRKLQDGALETFTPDNQTIHGGGKALRSVFQLVLETICIF